MNQITHQGEINLGSNVVPCFVLKDGRRVLSGRGLQLSLKMVDEPKNGQQPAGSRFSRYLNQKSLKPFIDKHLSPDHFQPITCYQGKARINGFEAVVLIDICNAFLEARRNIRLGIRQAIIAEQCEIIVSGFAKVGLISLIDEATGYQYYRERNELQKLIDIYVSEELRGWTKTFPDMYYREIFRLRGWDFTVNGIKKRPGVVGTWTNKLVYEQLPKGVLEALRRKTPRSESGNYSARFFQSLSGDLGAVHLDKQINSVITLMRISDDWYDFEAKFSIIQEKRTE